MESMTSNFIIAGHKILFSKSLQYYSPHLPSFTLLFPPPPHLILLLQFCFYLSIKLYSMALNPLVTMDDSYIYSICFSTGNICDFSFLCLSFTYFSFENSGQEITLNIILCLRMQSHVI